MRAPGFPVFAAALLASQSVYAGEPILRYTTYLIVDVTGKPTSVRFESRPYGDLHRDYVYRDQPAYAVIGSHGQALDDVDGKLSHDSTIAIPASAGPFAVVEAKPGNNYCIAHSEGAHGFVATPTAPLNVVRGFERLYFYVPKGVLSPRPEWVEKLSRPFAVAWRRVLDIEDGHPNLAVQWDRPGKGESPSPSFDVGPSDERPHSHWQEYAQFGLGPRPKDDPVTWAAIKGNGAFHTFGPSLAPPYYTGLNRYVACVEHPGWRHWPRSARPGDKRIRASSCSPTAALPPTLPSISSATWTTWCSKAAADPRARAAS